MNSHIDFEDITMSFLNNSAKHGGAIYAAVVHRELLISHFHVFVSGRFYQNKATIKGGAMYLVNINATLSGTFVENCAKQGGGIYVYNSSVLVVTGVFVGNVAEKGGGISAVSANNVTLVRANFTSNEVSECGGAFHTERHTSMDLQQMFIAVRNSGSAACIEKSKATFNGTVFIADNTGRLGGGIVINSQYLVSFFGTTYFGNNRGYIGGAMYSFIGAILTFSGLTMFENNTAETNGGAICALGSNITFWAPTNSIGSSVVRFISNLAENGGALYLSSSSFVTLDSSTKLSTSNNYASNHGGVFYYEDVPTSIQCSYNGQNTIICNLPYCFLNTTISGFLYWMYTIHSNDSSQNGGNYLYGGLLDRCQFYSWPVIPYNRIKQKLHNGIVTSKPYQLCFCEYTNYNCSQVKRFSVYRGQIFTLSLVALDQLRTAISTKVTAQTHDTARLRLGQGIQTLPANCSSLSYATYSTQTTEELTLYADGPCHDTGRAKVVVNVTLLPCPNGFVLSGAQCVCVEKLREYGATCMIDTDIHIIKEANSRFWVSDLYTNGSYLGMIHHNACPAQYCKTEILDFTLEDPDRQCTDHRVGRLCGACAANYSLMLGSTSRCELCSNTHLALLLPFAAAGIVLVVLLSVLRLTVASGIVNSIILYANIVQVNKNLFFPTYKPNVLTVFIAWVNLDLGIETCFYDGMTAYAQVWLQFVFPLYVWILICSIIIASRYSITMSKMIGHNPVAVLATLLLMSYTKILKLFIDVYSYANLSYPNNGTIKVWLKDGSMLYFCPWLIFLEVLASFVFIFLFLPYTILLLTGYKLYSISNRKFFHWLHKFKPFLDSYYAPYKKHTRFWIGFLLLLRCFLYFVFTFNRHLITYLVLIITFTALILLGWSLKWLYEKLHVIIIEFFIYFNIIALSVATLVHINSIPLVLTLIGTVFVATVGTILRHIHIFYIAKSALWLKLVIALQREHRSPPAEIPAITSIQDQHKVVTRTVIDFRESLLDSNSPKYKYT